MKAHLLVGQDLSGFHVIEIIEVYSIDDDGRKLRTLGFFSNRDEAQVFAESENANHRKVEVTLILTNGEVGYVISEKDPVALFKDEVEVVKLK